MLFERVGSWIDVEYSEWFSFLFSFLYPDEDLFLNDKIVNGCWYTY